MLACHEASVEGSPPPARVPWGVGCVGRAGTSTQGLIDDGNGVICASADAGGVGRIVVECKLSLQVGRGRQNMGVIGSKNKISQTTAASLSARAESKSIHLLRVCIVVMMSEMLGYMANHGHSAKLARERIQALSLGSTSAAIATGGTSERLADVCIQISNTESSLPKLARVLSSVVPPVMRASAAYLFLNADVFSFPLNLHQKPDQLGQCTSLQGSERAGTAANFGSLRNANSAGSQRGSQNTALEEAEKVGYVLILGEEKVHHLSDNLSKTKSDGKIKPVTTSAGPTMVYHLYPHARISTSSSAGGRVSVSSAGVLGTAVRTRELVQVSGWDLLNTREVRAEKQRLLNKKFRPGVTSARGSDNDSSTTKPIFPRSYIERKKHSFKYGAADEESTGLHDSNVSEKTAVETGISLVSRDIDLEGIQWYLI